MNDGFQAPEMRSGDIVYWWRLGLTTNKPLPAMVIMNNGRGNLCLTIFTPHGPSPLEGVKHADDPALNKRQREDFGCWKERPADV